MHAVAYEFGRAPPREFEDGQEATIRPMRSFTWLLQIFRWSMREMIATEKQLMAYFTCWLHMRCRWRGRPQDPRTRARSIGLEPLVFRFPALESEDPLTEIARGPQSLRLRRLVKATRLRYLAFSRDLASFQQAASPLLMHRLRRRRMTTVVRRLLKSRPP